MADNTISYFGQPVGVVVADDYQKAMYAANLVEIKIKQIEQEAINEINYKTTFYTIQTLKKIINIKINDVIHKELIDSALSDFNKN